MESEVVHSPSETPGGISSRGNAISSLEESQQRRGEIFLNMVLQNSKAENSPMATAILGSCRQPRARRGRGLWAIKTPSNSSELLSLSPPAPLVTSVPHSSLVSAGIWGHDKPILLAQGGSSIPGGRGLAGGSSTGPKRMWVQQQGGVVLVEFWDSDLQDPWAPPGSSSQGWLTSSWSHKRSLPPVPAFDLNNPNAGIKQPKPTGLGFFFFLKLQFKK